jgi:hypothetical protein
LCELNNVEPGTTVVTVDMIELLELDSNTLVWELSHLPLHYFRMAADVSIGTAIFTFGGQEAFNADCQCYAVSICSRQRALALVVASLNIACPAIKYYGVHETAHKRIQRGVSKKIFRAAYLPLPLSPFLPKHTLHGGAFTLLGTFSPTTKHTNRRPIA